MLFLKKIKYLARNNPFKYGLICGAILGFLAPFISSFLFHDYEVFSYKFFRYMVISVISLSITLSIISKITCKKTCINNYLKKDEIKN